uniref:Glyoxylate reductase/hydroxypyruvate reductase n=1 Tax=Panstrongylus lignarius TaxID=156445 RepID=A0A224XSU9_9HEMI
MIFKQNFGIILCKAESFRKFACNRKFSSMSQSKIFVTRSDYPKNSIAMLEGKFEVDIWDHESHGEIKKENLIKKIEGVHGLFCCLNDKIDKDIIKAGSDLKIVSTMSVGVDHIDKQALKEAKVRLGYTPDVLTEATAELTVALLLATSRRIFEANSAIIKGEWTSAWAPVWMCGPGLKGSTVGIVGFGRIGQCIASILKSFAIYKLLYSGPEERAEDKEFDATFTTLECLLEESDFVIVSCSLNETTKNLFSKEKFDLMKPTAIFINSSRGGVVDQEALYDALKSSKIRAAGLDVMVPEPLPCDHKLLTLSNCVILPHIGSATYQTRMAMSDLAAKNILAALTGEDMPAEFHLS